MKDKTSQAPACKSFYDIENQLRNCTCGTCPTTPPLEDIDFRIKPPEDIDFAWIPTSQTPVWRESFYEFMREKVREFNRIFGGYIETTSSMGISGGNKSKIWLSEILEKAYQKGREDMAKELQGTDPY